MVLERPARPADAVLLGPFLHRLGDHRGRQSGGVEEVEAIGAVQTAAFGGEQLHLAIAVGTADLGHGEARVIAVEQRADALEEAGDRVVALVVGVELVIERARARDAVVQRRRRIVAEAGIEHHEVDRIDTEAVDAPLQPEAGDVEERLLYRRMVAVNLRLLLQEVVHVILAAARVPRPCRAAEDRLPIVGRRAVGLGIVPDVPIGAGVVAAGPAFLEPRVPVAGVRPDLIDDDLHAERVRAGDERVEVGKRAEDRVDVAIIGHVIAEIGHRRPEEGRQPDRLDAQARDMVEVRGDAGQVADAVAIRIGEAARIDLIDGGAVPPGTVLGAILGRLHMAHRAGVSAQIA